MYFIIQILEFLSIFYRRQCLNKTSLSVSVEGWEILLPPFHPTMAGPSLPPSHVLLCWYGNHWVEHCYLITNRFSILAMFIQVIIILVIVLHLIFIRRILIATQILVLIFVALGLFEVQSYQVSRTL